MGGDWRLSQGLVVCVSFSPGLRARKSKKWLCACRCELRVQELCCEKLLLRCMSRLGVEKARIPMARQALEAINQSPACVACD